MKSPASSGGSRHAGAAGSASGSEDVALRARDRRFGEWKEDSKRGRGIQMRDLILVLELDGQEKKTLAKCLARQRSSD